MSWNNKEEKIAYIYNNILNLYWIWIAP